MCKKTSDLVEDGFPKFGLGNGFGFAIFEVLESTGVVWDGNGLTIAFLEFLSFLDGVQCTIG